MSVSVSAASGTGIEIPEAVVVVPVELIVTAKANVVSRWDNINALASRTLGEVACGGRGDGLHLTINFIIVVVVVVL